MHERVRNDHDYCYAEMPNEDNGEKSLKVPAIIYPDLECLLEKMHSCQNILKNLIEKKTKKLSMHLLVISYLQVVRLIQQKQT